MKSQLSSQSLTAKEIAFLAEQEPIFILPRYTMNGIDMIGPNMPKLRALQRTEVALWLAVLLKKQNKCSIVIPDWLSIPFLKSKYNEEQQKKERVSELPWHWIPTAKILLDVCSDDFIDSPHELRALIQDLREIRMLKTRQGFAMVDDEYLELTGLSLFEINEIRPFLLQTMDTLRNLKKVTLDEDEDGNEDIRGGQENFADQEEDIGYNTNMYDNEDNEDNGNQHDTNAGGEESPFRSHLASENDHSGVVNTSALGSDHTLVDTTSTTHQPAKRRRVNPPSNANNANSNNSDSDSDVEYRH